MAPINNNTCDLDGCNQNHQEYRLNYDGLGFCSLNCQVSYLRRRNSKLERDNIRLIEDLNAARYQLHLRIKSTKSTRAKNKAERQNKKRGRK